MVSTPRLFNPHRQLQGTFKTAIGAFLHGIAAQGLFPARSFFAAHYQVIVVHADVKVIRFHAWRFQAYYHVVGFFFHIGCQ